jgi:hypothetical protein
MPIIQNGSPVYDVIVNGVDVTNVIANGVSVYEPPVITTQPVGVSITDLESHVMTAASSDIVGNLTYQWYLNDVAISGATSTSFTHVASPVGSYTYHVVSTNGAGLDTSVDAIVTVTVSSSNSLFIEKDLNSSRWGFDGGYGSITPIEVKDFPVGDGSRIHEITKLTADEAFDPVFVIELDNSSTNAPNGMRVDFTLDGVFIPASFENAGTVSMIMTLLPTGFNTPTFDTPIQIITPAEFTQLMEFLKNGIGTTVPLETQYISG